MVGAERSIIDLLPAGPKLRAAKRIVWPESQFAMSLAGFDQVFQRSVPVKFATGAEFQVAPPAVIEDDRLYREPAPAAEGPH
jgi:predicted nucleotidyltransferase